MVWIGDYEIETKTLALVIAMVLIATISIGGVVFQIYDTGEELKCRTGDGWTILEDHESFFKAECQFKTKDWVTAYCSSFRSTATYERYGCNEVVLVEIDNTVTELTETVIDNTVTEETIIDNTITEEKTIIVNPVEYRDVPKGKQWLCPPKGVECVLVE